MIIACLAVAVAILLYRQSIQQPADEGEATAQAIVDKSLQVASPEPVGKSIAVLPLRDMSPEADQAYFSCGINRQARLCMIYEISGLDKVNMNYRQGGNNRLVHG